MNSDEENSQAPPNSEYESSPNQNEQTENSKANCFRRQPCINRSKKKTNHSSIPSGEPKCRSRSSDDGPTPDNSSNSSYSTFVDPKPLDMKKWRKLHVSILRGEENDTSISDSFVDSPAGLRPRCSSPNGQMISRSEGFQNISPINGGRGETSSRTFHTTETYSINRTERTLRARSFSFSGHENWVEKTISPRGQSKQSSSLSNSPGGVDRAVMAPMNTPAASCSTGRSSWESQGGTADDVGNVRINRTRLESSRRYNTDDIPFSSKKVSNWLLQMPSLRRSRAEEGSLPGTPRRIPYDPDLGDFGVSDFDEENDRRTRPPSCHSGNMPMGHYGEYLGHPGGPYPVGIQMQRNYPAFLEEVPLDYHRQYFSGYVPTIPSDANPYHRCCCQNVQGISCSCFQRGRAEVGDQGPRDSPRGSAGTIDKKRSVRVRGCKKKVSKGVFTSRSQMSRHLHWKSRNQNSSNSSITFLEDAPTRSSDIPLSPSDYRLPHFPGCGLANPPANANPCHCCCQNAQGVPCLCFQRGRAEVGDRGPRGSAGTKDKKSVKVQGCKKKVAKEVLRSRVRMSRRLHGKSKNQNSSNSSITVDYGTF